MHPPVELPRCRHRRTRNARRAHQLHILLEAQRIAELALCMQPQFGSRSAWWLSRWCAGQLHWSQSVEPQDTYPEVSDDLLCKQPREMDREGQCRAAAQRLPVCCINRRKRHQTNNTSGATLRRRCLKDRLHLPLAKLHVRWRHHQCYQTAQGVVMKDRNHGRTACAAAGWAGGCFSNKTSRTLWGEEAGSVPGTVAFKSKGVPGPACDSSRIAARTLPAETRAENREARRSSESVWLFRCVCATQCCWMVLTSATSSAIRPSRHSTRRRLRHSLWSFVFDDALGFWSRRAGITKTDFRATHSTAVALPNALNNRACSATKALPCFLDGRRKMFLRQVSIAE